MTAEEKKCSPKMILNFGAGVNSTALVIECVKRKIPLDYVIFADTGSELPETYEHIERMKIWFKEKGIKFVTVKSKYGVSLYDYYYSHKMIPSRKFRHCTDKFKITPITKFLKQFKTDGVMQLIGIANEERHRIRASKVKWIKFGYPLCEWELDREGCENIIRKENMIMPVKSGCFMCPFQRKEAWTDLLKTHPELFAKARLMEENGSRYPEITLPFDYTLKQYEEAVKQQRSLMEFKVADICDGWCMT